MPDHTDDPAPSTAAASISVVVPVYGSAGSLPELVRRLTAAVAPIASEYEILLVDDGSLDDSWSVVQRLALENGAVRGVALARHYSPHNALLAGIRLARFDVTVTLDDDFFQRPEEIPELLEALVPGVDLVYGYPTSEHFSLRRNVRSRVTKVALGAAVDAQVAAHITGFRVFRTALRDGFGDVQDPFLSLDVLLSWTTTRSVAVAIKGGQRSGTGRRVPRLSVQAGLNLLTGFGTTPLRVVTMLGVGLGLLGAALLVYVLGAYAVHGDGAQGFTFIASAIAIFSGAQLLALGIIGEYLGRMHYRAMRRPAYIVRSATRPPRP